MKQTSSRTTSRASFLCGTIQFNRIADNATGIRAKGNYQIIHNVVISNDLPRASWRARQPDVQIANNTFYSDTGDNIRLENIGQGSRDSRQTFSGPSRAPIFSCPSNSRSGFFSDYNQLYASGGGKLVHWMEDFTDLLDWQVDVNRYDLHSIGSTVINALAAQPAFVSMARDDYRLWNLVGGLRQTNPSIDGADPRNDVGTPTALINRLVDPSFDREPPVGRSTCKARPGTEFDAL